MSQVKNCRGELIEIKKGDIWVQWSHHPGEYHIPDAWTIFSSQLDEYEHRTPMYQTVTDLCLAGV